MREPIFHTKKAWKFQEKKSKQILKWILQWELSSWLGRQWDLQTAGIRTRRRLKQSNFPIFLFVLSFSFFFLQFLPECSIVLLWKWKKEKYCKANIKNIEIFLFPIYYDTPPGCLHLATQRDGESTTLFFIFLKTFTFSFVFHQHISTCINWLFLLNCSWDTVPFHNIKILMITSYVKLGLFLWSLFVNILSIFALIDMEIYRYTLCFCISFRRDLHKRLHEAQWSLRKSNPPILLPPI